VSCNGHHHVIRPNLDDPGFSQLWVDTVKATVYAGHFLKQLPIMHTILNAVPIWILGAINPGMGMLLQWRKVGSANEYEHGVTINCAGA
jgi:hypothetical protein